MEFFLENLKRIVLKKGYIFFDDKNNKGFDVNIIGIRNNMPGNDVTNYFDDWITISYKQNNEWQFKIWPATTDPGRKGVLEYHNINGVARVIPGQYRASHRIGLHQGKYEALVQNKPLKIFRDSNKDLVFDENKIQEGLFGINIHKAGKDSNLVENWSEGCQVFKRSADFDEFMNICNIAKKIHGNSFSYTLIESNDLM